MKAGRAVPVLLALAAMPTVAGPLVAQSPPLWVRAPDGQPKPIEVHSDRGWAAIDATALEELGWELERKQDTLLVTSESESLRFVAGSPFYAVGAGLRQLAEAPYESGDEIYLPAQLLTDALPASFPELFSYDAATRTVSPMVAALATAPAVAATFPEKLVVVIDAGHGGGDPGTTGATGVREKEVALRVALALREVLASDTLMEVHMVRTADRRVSLWRRGELATQWKGPRPGVFISLHANALPTSPRTRGFETYVLSEARTEHESRVAAIENSAAVGEVPERAESDPELALILRELRNFDHQHWSLLLAELVQSEMQSAHSGPERGVKQAPLAVITNALMPAVLVELGFLTNRTDELLLASEEFQAAAADAIARAVRRFFSRYPAAGALGAVR